MKDPQFSPDDSEIIFCTSLDNSGGDIYSVNGDGTNVVSLSQFATSINLTAMHPGLLLSPTGTKVYFSGHFTDTGGLPTPAGWIMNLNATEMVSVPANAKTLTSFSPDGSRLAGVDTHGGIIVLTTSGETIVSVNPPDGEIFSDVKFSPDGTKLIAVLTWAWEEWRQNCF